MRPILIPLVLLCAIWTLSYAQKDAPDDALAPLVEVLRDSDDPAFQLDILKGMADALKGRRGIKMPADWPKVAAKLAKSPNAEVRTLTASLSTLFGDVASIDAARKVVMDKKAPAEERRKALASLLDNRPPDLATMLQQLLADADLRGAALKGLAAYDDPKTPAAIFSRYNDLTPAEKLDALNTLAAREGYALELIKALDQKKVQKTDMTAATIRTLSELKNANIDQWLAANWGNIRSSPEDKLKEISQVRQLVAAAKGKVDVSRGRAIYAKTCQQCHTLFGEGGKVGPDLTGSGRADLEYLLTNVIDPNAVVGKDYQVWNIRLKDKRQIAGIISRQDEQTVTVQTENETITLGKNEIMRMKQSDVSMMPEGLVTALPEHEIVELFEYLRSPQQVPMAATQPVTKPAQ